MIREVNKHTMNLFQPRALFFKCDKVYGCEVRNPISTTTSPVGFIIKNISIYTEEELSRSSSSLTRDERTTVEWHETQIN